ncbi:MAG: glycosyltransferase [Chitinivibrionales bacterium]|nr:glycosyltransferase [Chitinivibrionales bacterium]
MNIALVNPEYPTLSGVDHGGTATYTYNCANALHALGHRVYVLAKNGTIPDYLSPGIEYVEFEPEPNPRFTRIIDRFKPGEIAWEQAYSRGLHKKLHAINAKNRLDIVDIPEYNGLAYELKHPLPFKVVINFRTPRILVDRLNKTKITATYRKWYAFEKKAAKNGVAYRTSSNALQQKVAVWFDIPKSKIAVIRNPVDTCPFDTIQKRDRFRMEIINVLFAGRIEYRKGAELIVKTIDRILALDDRINVTFAGEPRKQEGDNYQDSIERSVDLEQRKRLWFLGPIKHNQLPVLFSNSDIFFIPSLFDNSPNSLLEAMACGMPVVASDTGGINEIIEHKRNGLLFSLADTDSLIGCFREYLNDPECAIRMGQQARRDCKNLYLPPHIGSQIVDFYKEIGA